MELLRTGPIVSTFRRLNPMCKPMTLHTQRNHISIKGLLIAFMMVVMLGHAFTSRAFQSIYSWEFASAYHPSNAFSSLVPFRISLPSFDDAILSFELVGCFVSALIFAHNLRISASVISGCFLSLFRIVSNPFLATFKKLGSVIRIISVTLSLPFILFPSHLRILLSQLLTSLASQVLVVKVFWRLIYGANGAFNIHAHQGARSIA